jgi:hypothetical protein
VSDYSGEIHNLSGNIRDSSEHGIGMAVAESLQVGMRVDVNGKVSAMTGDRSITSLAHVRWCVAHSHGTYRIGLALVVPREAGSTPNADAREEHTATSRDADDSDYYELLQLSPKADADTINRVFRILAARYHPDNTETGDVERFRQLAQAHDVLCDPTQRAAYDAQSALRRRDRVRIFESATVTTGPAAELRKRTGVLSALYIVRSSGPQTPGLTLRELEDLLGCPKEHMEFAVWYLKESGLIARGDNGRYQITIKGVDAAESASGLSVSQHLLPAAAGTT